MIAFPHMLVAPADEAGIITPPDPDDYDPKVYTRFHLFCCAQLGTPMPSATAHWENAKVIMKVPADQVETITGEELIARGFQQGFPTP